MVLPFHNNIECDVVARGTEQSKFLFLSFCANTKFNFWISSTGHKRNNWVVLTGRVNIGTCPVKSNRKDNA